MGALPFKQGVRGSSPRWSTKITATPSGVAVILLRRGLESKSNAPVGRSSTSSQTNVIKLIIIKNGLSTKGSFFN